MSTINVILRELKTVAKRIVDMGLGREVHYSVNVLSDEKIVDKIGTCNIPLDKLKVWGRFRGDEVFKVRAVIQFVQDDNLVIGVVSDEPICNMTCNESSSPCDKNILRSVFCHYNSISATKRT